MPLTTTILGQEGEPTILALITQTSKFLHRKFDNPHGQIVTIDLSRSSNLFFNASCVNQKHQAAKTSRLEFSHFFSESKKFESRKLIEAYSLKLLKILTYNL